MKSLSLLLLLAIASTAFAQQAVQRIRPSTPTPVVAPAADPAASATLVKDYESMYRKEAEKNRQLKAEVQTLTDRIAELTRHGGSLVQAYCETPSMSRNTAGASNDCAAAGFGCEPVSGLCRTTARSSDQCAAGFVYCSKYANCVRTAQECQ